MTATHILALLIMLVIPAFVTLLGVKRMNSTTALGAKGGYRSERSMSSPAAWAFAQKACGIRYVIGGVVMAVCSVLLTLILPVTKTVMASVIYALVFAVSWIVVVLVLMVLVEFALIGKHYGA